MRDDLWSEERTRKAVDLWKLGHTAAQIAQALGGLTRNAVIGKLNRMGFRRSPGFVGNRQFTVPWTTEREDRIRAMWLAGLLDHEIANQLGGTTASAVCHRRKLRGWVQGSDDSRPAATRQSTAKRVVSIYAAASTPAPKPAPRIEDATQARPWLSLERGECAWIVSGEGADAMVCCKRVKPGKPYCPTHAARAASPNQPAKVKDLARSLRRYA